MIINPLVDMNKIKEKYGEDKPELVEIFQALNEKGRRDHETISELKQQRNVPDSNQNNDETNRIVSDMKKFFSDKDIQEYYSEIYGMTKETMMPNQWSMVITGEQYNNRVKLIQEADAYMAGAKLQGLDVSYVDALERAHLALNKDNQSKIERNKLKKKIKKRSRSITVKSSAKKKITPKETKKTKEKKFFNKTKQRMKEAFGIEPNA